MPEPAAPRRTLSLFDSTSIIMGIMIGSAIYELTPLITRNVPSGAALLGVWFAGGVLALAGALTYAELATAWPQEGGEYVYLTRAYSPRLGLLFAWADYWIIRPGNTGAMAYLFAIYAAELVPFSANSTSPLAHYQVPLLAVGAISLLTILNLLGVRSGKWTQNALTIAKVLGLLMVVAVGLLLTAPASAPAAPAATSSPTASNMRLALILVMFAYGGWSEIACVAAEVRDPRRNLLRALVVGTIAVAAVYLLVNLAFLRSLGHAGLIESQAAAADVVGQRFGDLGRRAVSVLICVSALGAINGMLFTGSRIYYALGTQHRLFAWIGRWSRGLDAPVVALLLQAAVTVGLVIAFGPEREGFEKLIIFTTPVYWLFALLVGIALFVLRRSQPDAERPYRVLGYPLTPLIFCGLSLLLMYASVDYAIANRSWEVLWSLVMLAAGGLLCFFDRSRPPSNENNPGTGAA